MKEVEGQRKTDLLVVDVQSVGLQELDNVVAVVVVGSRQNFFPGRGEAKSLKRSGSSPTLLSLHRLIIT